jgi:hypothetical protein
MVLKPDITAPGVYILAQGYPYYFRKNIHRGLTLSLGMIPMVGKVFTWDTEKIRALPWQLLMLQVQRPY